ncbi:MAG TPA: NYN domain-containing protein [Actinomycetes bacterium]|nr:NYN domain-containing protein [Actinomycetes bacterium]
MTSEPPDLVGESPDGQPLPDAVRDRVAVLAAAALGTLAADQVPPRLRAVARFAPAKRARAGATALAAALENDPGFRVRVAARAREDAPDLAEALEAGRLPVAADPVEVAAVAYLLDAEVWPAAVRQVRDEARTGRGAQERAELARVREQLETARAQARAEQASAREALEAVRRELAASRREVRELRASYAEEQARAQAAAASAEAASADARRQVAAAEADLRRVRARLAEAEAGLEAGRRAAREGRSVAEVRLRLLLDTVLDAAAGLRRELALPPVPEGARPGDGVDARAGAAEDVRARALDRDDPAHLDQLLALPQVHLVVDGYNVTKTGFGGLSLEEQRARLTTRLAALVAQTGAEVSVVFDGASLDVPAPSPAPRGVRVLFSPAGTTADEVIRRLVRAEPTGRPVVVVSSDREVADGVRAAGARPVASTALLRRLERS